MWVWVGEWVGVWVWVGGWVGMGGGRSRTDCAGKMQHATYAMHVSRMDGIRGRAVQPEHRCRLPAGSLRARRHWLDRKRFGPFIHRQSWMARGSPPRSPSSPTRRRSVGHAAASSESTATMPPSFLLCCAQLARRRVRARARAHAHTGPGHRCPQRVRPFVLFVAKARMYRQVQMWSGVSPSPGADVGG